MYRQYSINKTDPNFGGDDDDDARYDAGEAQRGGEGGFHTKDTIIPPFPFYFS